MENKFIKWDDINLKSKRGGTLKTTCPECSSSRKNPKDPCLFVSLNIGYAICYNCEKTSFRDSLDSRQKEIAIRYDLPPQNWHNFTSLHDSIAGYFLTRKIGLKTLNDFNVTQELAYQPARGSEVTSIVFNYFELDTIVNKKYRSLKKEFTQSKNGKPILFNINSAIGADELYITEGEIDVLSFYEIGIKNAVSLPNGANDNDAFWINSEPYLKDIKKFYIATDMDEKGEMVAEKIAQRLGRYRCERVVFNGKDANDDLQNLELHITHRNTRKYPVSGTLTVNDLDGDIDFLFANGIPVTKRPKSMEFDAISEIFSTMDGQLTTVTGIPSSGKSNFTEWYLLNIIKDYDAKVSFFTPEHTPYSLFHSKMAEKTIGKPFFERKHYDSGVTRMTKDELNLYKNWANERIYITSPDYGQNPDWKFVFDTFEAQMMRYGVNIFVIDAYNKVITKPNETHTQIITQITAFCSKHNVEVYLIAHPTKMQKDENNQYKIPTLYDCSGSADFRNQTHNGYIIHREYNSDGNDRTLFINGKTKFTFQGEIGKSAVMIYDKMNGRYYPESGVPNRKSLLDINYDSRDYFKEEPTTIDFTTTNDDLPF